MCVDPRAAAAAVCSRGAVVVCGPVMVVCAASHRQLHHKPLSRDPIGTRHPVVPCGAVMVHVLSHPIVACGIGVHVTVAVAQHHQLIGMAKAACTW